MILTSAATQIMQHYTIQFLTSKWSVILCSYTIVMYQYYKWELIYAKAETIFIQQLASYFYEEIP